MEIGLLIIRLIVGLTLTAHGVQKLFGWFGGYGLTGTGQFFEKLGFVPGKLNAFLAGITEASGLLLVLGLATPLGSLLCFSVMLVATVSVHLKGGFFIQKQGYEYCAVLGLTSLALAFTGPGALSLDSVLGFNYSGLYVGLGVLVLGIIGSAIQLATRKIPATPQA
jgi:putative oxidoreductase